MYYYQYKEVAWQVEFQVGKNRHDPQRNYNQDANLSAFAKWLKVKIDQIHKGITTHAV